MRQTIFFFIALFSTASCYVEPEIVHVTGIMLNSSSANLIIGETLLLEAAVSPDNAADKTVQWRSSAPEVASVKDGYINAISEGETRIVAETTDGGYIARCLIVVKPPYIIVDGQKCVDLGLSVKWAYCNVGALKPEEYGDFYAWGEVLPKNDYTLDNYKFWGVTEIVQEGENRYSYYGFTKYCTGNRQYSDRHDKIDGKLSLELTDDAVHYHYGGAWRMPTYQEWNELHTSCKWEWTEMNNVDGYLVTGKNGNKIFLPNAGQVLGTTYYTTWTQYWSSSLDLVAPGNYAAYSSWCMDWRHLMSKEGKTYESREHGYCVRGVIK